ncbi:benzoate transporter [Photobacterium angustum]|uniref:Benzoate transporter n=1 Tax=Photobacterium angustum TaxID=661 RepID=A0A2T3LVZ9_PHOAN|nr:benzoate/H(+) symporter BenE family transporter [Photobacterium angustum]KJF83081.1 benzoate transporter [Photobacterium damselae subsp. damselae]KJF96115.1 benzoate transporter [Photobacterium angustum]KJG02822.1 benzoate transporter [Photobacterium angustum]KJG06560.1 benzoate transporter [Photobacterium angustum]KJG29792.1 benzoate transporter [Photobacterium angustum]
MNDLRFNLSHISAGTIAVLVGYTSSVILVIHALTEMGLAQWQVNSWLFALGLIMGITTIAYSFYFKVPVLTAWSTPGAAFLITAVQGYSATDVIGAFIVCGLLTFISGLIRPLALALQRIPPPITSALLCGVILPICLSGFTQIETHPIMFLLLFSVYIITKRFMARYSMLLTLLASVGIALYSNTLNTASIHMAIPTFYWLTPSFHFQPIINIAIPLYLITMLSQNIAGFAVLQNFQFKVPVRPVFLGTGLVNMIAAPCGIFTLNLAAISAAICMNDDIDGKHSDRYKAAICAGGFYMLVGIWASIVVAIFVSLPDGLADILASFALLTTLISCLFNAFSTDEYRESAILTLLITLSGIHLLGISAAIWGVGVGLCHFKLMQSRKPVLIAGR